MGIREPELQQTSTTTTATTTTLTHITTRHPTKATRKVKKNSATMCPLRSLHRSPAGTMPLLVLVGGLLLLVGPALSRAAEEPAKAKSQAGADLGAVRSTQPSVDRQVDAPNSSPVVSWSAPSVPAAQQNQQVAHKEQPVAEKAAEPSTPASKQPYKPKQLSGSQRKSALASQQNYDKYQLKASNSNYHNSVDPSVAAGSAAASPTSDESASGPKSGAAKAQDEQDKAASQSKPASAVSDFKKSGYNAQRGQANSNKAKSSSSFSLLKKFLPSFMTSPGSMAAAAAAASAMVDKHQLSHSRSSQSSPLSATGDGPLAKASGKIINLLSSKKAGAVPDHAPFFIRKPSIDRQSGFASGLLSNPLSLGLLFSAPLIPSLLLTPLAIAGLSPAMSAINNFFGDDEEASTPASSNSPLSVLTGPSSPLSSFLQGSSAAQQASGNQASGAAGGQSSASSSLALQAIQSILGPPSTTERPLFNPGMFASQGIQNAIGSLGSSSSSSSSSSSGASLSGSSSGSSAAGGLSQPSNSPIRNFLGGNLIQTAASMISPSFAAPPSSSSGSSSSSSDSDDGPGFMQVASDVFDKVANYMSPERDIAPAASSGSISTAAGPGVNPAPSSPLSALINLSSFSPFQLSSLFASSPFASAIAAPAPSSATSGASSGSSGATAQRAGFFSTLKNVYELFSSSFLRRQEVGDSNECQQRLLCELHQRAMNSKLFRRSVQSNLMELAQLDRSIQEQLKLNNPLQARVDADTKAMLNDFLKATNNFKNGRELVNCSKMFPKCSRAMLLSAANAHLSDPNNSKAIGKFSSLMKKMKFKSNQQHQSQWKLRKPNKINAVQMPARTSGQAQPINQYQSVDYLQVAPLSTTPQAAGKPAQAGQLTPADSLKLVQQIMLMSQQQQQQQQQVGQQQQYGQQAMQYVNQNQNNQQQQQQQVYNSPPQPVSSYQNTYAQYSQNGPQMSNIYTDAVLAPMYSSTDSPYFMQPQQVANGSPDMSSMQQVPSQQQQQQSQLPQHPQHQNMQQQQQASHPAAQQQQQVAQQLPNSYQLYPTSTSTMPDGHMTSVISSDKKNQPQQQQTGMTGGSVASAA